MLSLVAVVASALFVSCAQKKEPDFVAAFPKHHFVEVEKSEKGTPTWTWDTSLYNYTYPKGVGFVKDVNHSHILNFRVTPNADWEMSITSGAEYIDLRTGYGAKEENYTYGDVVSGVAGLSTIGLHVVNYPTLEEGEKDVELTLSIAGEKLKVVTITVLPAAADENADEEEGDEENA